MEKGYCHASYEVSTQRWPLLSLLLLLLHLNSSLLLRGDILEAQGTGDLPLSTARLAVSWQPEVEQKMQPDGRGGRVAAEAPGQHTQQTLYLEARGLGAYHPHVFAGQKEHL